MNVLRTGEMKAYISWTFFIVCVKELCYLTKNKGNQNKKMNTEEYEADPQGN